MTEDQEQQEDLKNASRVMFLNSILTKPDEQVLVQNNEEAEQLGFYEETSFDVQNALNYHYNAICGVSKEK